MPAAHKSAISVGLLYIPVRLHKTTRNASISFNQLCRDSKERIRYKKYCPSCDKEIKNEDLLVVYPTKECLIAKVLFYQEEIQEMPKPQARVEVSKQELDMAKALIESMTKTFDISAYHDEYQEKLQKAIMTKIDGNEIVAADTGRQENIIDLMEALQRSVELAENGKKAGSA